MMFCSDEQSARLYADLVVSATALAARQTGSFTIFQNLSGQEPGMQTAEELRAASDRLSAAFADIPGEKGAYLRDMLRATDTLVRLLEGNPLPYAQAIERILGFVPRSISPARKERAAGEIDRILTDAGYRDGTLAGKVQSWYGDHRLDASDLIPTAEKYLSLLQRETRRLVSLPAEEGWGKLDTAAGVVYAALSQYQGHYVTNVTLNRESAWRLPSFIDTISHELYPGHHTWYTRREQLFREGRLPLEATMSAVCMADNLLFEGVPESGIFFLGIEDPEKDIPGLDPVLRKEILLARKISDYVRILQIDACFGYHIEGWDREKTIETLCAGGWVLPATAGRVFRYFSHPVNGLYYPAYYFGRWLVTYARDQFGGSVPEEFFQILYDEPHTTGTFIRRIRELSGREFDSFGEAVR